MRCLLRSFLLSLLIPSVSWAAPSSSLTIDPAAVAGNTITAADENDRNNDVTTAYNSHDHTDISQVGNTLNVGDGLAGNKSICGNAADSTDRCIRWDDTNDLWVVQNPTTTYNMIATLSGTAGVASGTILTGNGTGAFIGNTPPSGSTVVYTAGDVATTSTTFVKVTGATITVTTQNHPVLVGFSGTTDNSVAGNDLIIGLTQDGVRLNGVQGYDHITGTGAGRAITSFTHRLPPVSEGSHTYELLFRVSAGTGTIQGDTDYPYVFWVQEIFD